jgi:putative oxidoreductase
MTASATTRPADVDTRRGKALNITLWCVQALLALTFLNASTAKLMSKPEMVTLFGALGIGQWFRYVTGILELTAAVLIVLPKTKSLGAALLVPIMVGALIVNLFVVHITPLPPLVLLLLAIVVLWGRRRDLERFLGR